jgi:hypothetical protein
VAAELPIESLDQSHRFEEWEMLEEERNIGYKFRLCSKDSSDFIFLNESHFSEANELNCKYTHDLTNIFKKKL